MPETHADSTMSTAAIDRRFARDGIRAPVRQQSPEISRLRKNARLLEALWRGRGRARRLEVFRALSPYTKLAFFAARPRNARYLLRKKNWETYLARVARRAGRTRPASVIASHLLFIAAGLGDFGGVERAEQIAQEKARRAAVALELAMAYPDCPIEAFVNAAAVYQRLRDWERVLSVGLEAERRMDARGGAKGARRGVDGFDVGAAVRASVLLAAEKLGRADVLAEFARPGRGGSVAAAVLDRLFELITHERYDDALALGRRYRDGGGELTPEVLANLVAINSFRGDATQDLEFFETALGRLAGEELSPAYLAQPDLLGNVCWVLNEQQRCGEALALIAAHEKLRPALPAVLWDRRMYAARFGADAGEARRRAEELLAKHAEDPAFLREQPWAFYNAACVLAGTGARERALEALAAAKALGCDVARMSAEDFGPLADDPEVRDLLGVGLVT